MAKPINYKQVFARKRDNEARILKLCPSVKPTSGIYWFYRVDENDIKYGYIGKCEKNILARMSDHLSGFQRIDLSIKKWGLYDQIKNPHGYKCGVICYCPPEKCDELEAHWIKEWANKGVQLRNIQSGGSLGRSNISENRPSKGYYDGLTQGEKKTKEQVKTYFDKYLDFVIKPPTGKVKERKFNEFKEWLDVKD